MTAPVATYRIQFREGMDFTRAEALVPYLRRLGISHLYASPLFSATPGSTHGYDVTDCNEIEAGLGGRAGLEQLSRTLHAAGLGLILDIVPNHMAASLENDWWRSVVEWGEQSPFARHFDIDWSGKLTLPQLGKPYSDCVEAGEIALDIDADSGCVALRYFDQFFPLHPASYEEVFAQFQAPMGTAIARRAADAGPEDEDRFHDAVRQIIASGDVAALRAEMESKSRQAGFLDWVHGEQPYVLTLWKEARRRLSYRRFFEVTGLVGLRVEDEAVFADVHRLVFELVRNGTVDGLRVDHVDGLADPAGYLDRLRTAVGPDIPILVEKILEADEKLPPEWPIQGTTGYECIAAIAGLMTDSAGLDTLGVGYSAFTGRRADLDAAQDAAKHEMLTRNFEGEVSRLAELAATAFAEAGAGLSEREIRTALVALAAAFPVYRTYGDADDVGREDVALVRSVAEAATQNADATGADTISALAALLIGEGAAAGSDIAGEFRVRFQQLTGPIMAKAVEDTLFYRYNQLIGLNEVGGDPRLSGDGLQGFHDFMLERVATQPFGLSASSTHDTKRGEDARARLYALSEYGAEWNAAVARWEALGGEAGADTETRWLVYQALAGVWPEDLQPSDGDGLKRLAERFSAYLEKALREAKRRTNWTAPDAAYEKAALGHARKLLTPNSPFIEDFVRTLQPIMRAGHIKSLAQTIVKLTMPGVPDIYQGSEGRNLSLVDPDNRRVPDFARLEAELEAKSPSDLQTPYALKQKLVAACLASRAANPELFAAGDYAELDVEGSGKGMLVAYMRVHGAAAAITLVPRLTRPLLDARHGYAADAWKDTSVILPELFRAGRWRNIVNDEDLESGESLPIGRPLAELPVALLVNDAAHIGGTSEDVGRFERQAWSADNSGR